VGVQTKKKIYWQHCFVYPTHRMMAPLVIAMVS